MQSDENTRKNSFLNYESPALTAELQAYVTLGIKIQQSARDQPRKLLGTSVLSRVDSAGNGFYGVAGAAALS